MRKPAELPINTVAYAVAYAVANNVVAYEVGNNAISYSIANDAVAYPAANTALACYVAGEPAKDVVPEVAGFGTFERVA